MDTFNRQIFLIPEISGSHAHDFTECLGKFTAVIITAFAGNLQNRSVCILKHSGGRKHFLRADIRIDGISVHVPETLLELGRGDLKLFR